MTSKKRGKLTAVQRVAVIVSPTGVQLGEFDEAELEEAARILVAELLSAPDDRERVSTYVRGLLTVDEVPAPVLLAHVVQVLVVDVLGRMTPDSTGRAFLRSIAARLRAGEQL